MLSNLSCLPPAFTRPGGPRKAPRPAVARSRSPGWPPGVCGKPSVDCVDMTWSCTSSQSDCPLSAWPVVLERKVGRSTPTRFTGVPADKSGAGLFIASIRVVQTCPVGATTRNRVANSSPPRRDFARAVNSSCPVGVRSFAPSLLNSSQLASRWSLVTRNKSPVQWCLRSDCERGSWSVLCFP